MRGRKKWGARPVKRFHRWFNIRFRTRKSWHPWGKPQLSRPAWWRDGGEFSVARDTYSEARSDLDEWMDRVAGEQP